MLTVFPFGSSGGNRVGSTVMYAAGSATKKSPLLIVGDDPLR
jgi:hypothetical protein